MYQMEALLRLDGAIVLWIQNTLRTPALSALLCPFTKMGHAGILWIAVSLLLLIPKRTRRAGILALGSMLLGFLVSNVLIKPLVGRVRPWLVVEGLTALVAERDPASFPSGHAACAFAACCAWAGEARKKWQKALLLLPAAVMAFSRLYVGVHFPSDVLVGALIGAAAALVIRPADRQLRRH